VIHYRNY